MSCYVGEDVPIPVSGSIIVQIDQLAAHNKKEREKKKNRQESGDAPRSSQVIMSEYCLEFLNFDLMIGLIVSR